MNSNQPDLFGSVPAVTLEVRGGVPSFKNSKMLITRDPRGRPLRKPMLITKPELQQRMEAITESLRYQLLSAFKTADGVILMGQPLRCLIALSTPDDDCWTRIPVLKITAELCDPGEEGATITIKRI